jgi:hypothetical protein
MQNYLYRLAVRALGQPTALRPPAAPLFAPSPSVAPSGGVGEEANGRQPPAATGTRHVKGVDVPQAAKSARPVAGPDRHRTPLERATGSEISPQVAEKPAALRPGSPSETPVVTPRQQPKGVERPGTATDARTRGRSAAVTAPDRASAKTHLSADTSLRTEPSAVQTGAQSPAASVDDRLASSDREPQTRSTAPPPRAPTMQNTRVPTVHRAEPAQARPTPPSRVGRGLQASADTRALSTPPREQVVPLRTLLPAPKPTHDIAQSEPRPARVDGATAERPVVKVTIGRIEVRAVTPPTPPRPVPTRARKTLSLDEYLGRQSRGGR